MMPADSRPLCAEPEHRDLVDRSFERTKDGNAAARQLALLCRRCPVAAACLGEAVARTEHGVWAGTRRTLTSNSTPYGPLRVA